MRKTYSIYIYLRLSLLTVEANVVGQQVVISEACNHIVLRNERVLSVICDEDNIKQFCVVVILSHTIEALVDVLLLNGLPDVAHRRSSL